MPRPISDQVIVVTGASSGIGLVTAREAARRGARVVLAARNAGDLERAVEEIRQAGGTAIAVPTDVADQAQVDALARRAVEEYGRIDTWVNNAAVSAYATFQDTPVEDFRRVLEVNVMGQVHGAKAALPHLEASGGALVCVGSAESDRGMPLQSAYAASKHAIKGWLDALRVELRKAGSPVRVTLIKPSSIDTPLFEHARTRLGVVPRGYPPVYAPELVARAILYAAEHDVRDLYVGTAGKTFSLLERIAPRLIDLQFTLTGYRLQKTDRPKSVDAPDNLYAPLPNDGGERGTTSGRVRTWSLYPWATEHRAGVSLAMAALAMLGALGVRRAASRGRR